MGEAAFNGTGQAWKLLAELFRERGDDVDDEDVLYDNCFPKLLEHIADSLDAEACILWEEAPASSPEAPPAGKKRKSATASRKPPVRQFFILGAWYRAGKCLAAHNVPEDSPTGKAILADAPTITHGLLAQEKHALTGLMRDQGLDVMLAAPMTYFGGTPGAVTVYRKEGADEFTQEDCQRLDAFAKAVPWIIRRDREHLDLRLLRRIEYLMHAFENPQGAGNAASDHDIAGLLDCLNRICDEISKAFHCIEVSFVLENWVDRPGAFELTATSWEARRAKDMETAYRVDPTDGGGGYCLAERESIRIFDMRNPDAEHADQIYKGLRIRPIEALIKAIRRHYRIDINDDIPSISSIFVPIEFGERISGLIRCTAARIEEGYCGPYYFAKRDMVLLELAAGQIGRFWHNWLTRFATERENETWKQFVNELSAMNSEAVKIIERDPSDMEQNRLFEQSLALVSRVVPGAEILDVRRKAIVQNGEVLRFDVVYGKAWSEGDATTRRVRLDRAFPLANGSKMAGCEVYRSGSAIIENDVSSAPDRFSLTFPETKRMIIVPIAVGGRKIGVLDVRSTQPGEFPEFTGLLMEMLGRQLALYDVLFENFRELRTKLQEVEEERQRQRQLFGDMAHQLRTPMLTAVRQSMKLAPSDPTQRTHRELMVLRGHVGRIRRVVDAMNVLAQILDDMPVTTRCVPMDIAELRKLLVQLAEDAELVSDPAQELRFGVDRAWLWASGGGSDMGNANALKAFRIDPGLLQQAVGNLIDNAGKHSYPRTNVNISVRITGSGNLCIEVANTGIRLYRDETQHCKQREWRSEAAMAVTGSGSGLGLWIVDSIMQAHQGFLEAIPTDSRNRTAFRLIFPRTPSE